MHVYTCAPSRMCAFMHLKLTQLHNMCTSGMHMCICMCMLACIYVCTDVLTNQSLINFIQLPSKLCVLYVHVCMRAYMHVHMHTQRPAHLVTLNIHIPRVYIFLSYC